MIFLSYSWKDQPAAHEIDTILRSHGCDVWIDFRELDPEADITQQLDSAIRDCSLFLAIRPSHRKSSPWMEAESLMARRHRKPTLQIQVRQNELSAIEQARTLLDAVAGGAHMALYRRMSARSFAGHEFPSYPT